MPLHLIKLCVGIEDIAHLRRVQRIRLDAARAVDPKATLAHITRMTPRRSDELLDGGSLYWVIRRQVQVRQRLLDIVRFTDSEGIGRCRLVIDPELVPLRPHPRRAFQGWRYLEASDAPPDLQTEGSRDAAEMPAEMRASLMEMGLI
jgi:hypothetical protein